MRIFTQNFCVQLSVCSSLSPSSTPTPTSTSFSALTDAARCRCCRALSLSQVKTLARVGILLAFVNDPSRSAQLFGYRFDSVCPAKVAINVPTITSRLAQLWLHKPHHNYFDTLLPHRAKGVCRLWAINLTFDSKPKARHFSKLLTFDEQVDSLHQLEYKLQAFLYLGPNLCLRSSKWPKVEYFELSSVTNWLSEAQS